MKRHLETLNKSEGYPKWQRAKHTAKQKPGVEENKCKMANSEEEIVDITGDLQIQ